MLKRKYVLFLYCLSIINILQEFGRVKYICFYYWIII